MLRLLVVAALCAGALASSAEQQLLEQLHERLAGRHVRPVQNYGDALPVGVELSVIDVDVDAAHHKAAISGWLHMSWNVSALSWEDADDEVTHQISDVRASEADIWTPDIVVYNMLPDDDWKVATLAHVSRSGAVHYVPMLHFTVRCQHQLSADAERLVCPIKLGSWTYSAAQVDLQAIKEGVDLSEFHANGDWAVESGDVTRHEGVYECCPDAVYPSLNMTLVLKPQRS